VQAYLTNRTAPPDALVATLSDDTGIAESLWRSEFNLFPDTVQRSLVPGQLLGRYDARVSVPVNSPLAQEGDPSSTFISAPFASAMSSYLVSSLRYTNHSTYTELSDAIDHWNFAHDGRPLPDTVPDLAAAFALDPALKLLSVNGYHDLATPFFQTERDLARLGGSAPVQTRFYAGGHMTYLDDDSRPLERADVQAFYAQALGVAGVQRAARERVSPAAVAREAAPAARGGAAPTGTASSPTATAPSPALTPAAPAEPGGLAAASGAMRDPWVPTAVRARALAQPLTPPSQGEVLAAQVQRKLQALRARAAAVAAPGAPSSEAGK
jgi:hypothetical protein